MAKQRNPKQHAAISGYKFTAYHMDGFMDFTDLMGVLGHLSTEDQFQKHCMIMW